MTHARAAARWLSLALVLAALWAILRWAPASAQDTELQGPTASRTRADHGLMQPGAAAGGATAASLRLDLAVAKVAANEASLARVRPDDVALIWQVTEGHGDTDAERLRWLTAHSSCVLTSRSLSAFEQRSNCRWSRGLTASGREPAGWSSTYPGLAWGPYRGRWAQVRELARRLVSGELDLRPCPETPDTWGGRVIDMEQALRRGLRPVGCVGTVNEGFVYASRGDS